MRATFIIPLLFRVTVRVACGFLAFCICVSSVSAQQYSAQQYSAQSAKGIRVSAGVSLRAIRAYLEAPKRIAVVAQTKRISKHNPGVIIVHNPQSVLNELLQVKPAKTHLVR
jgi:hypothetical protein